MIIERVSMLTGTTHQIDLPVTQAQLDAHRDGAMAQDAFPNLSASQREFIMTGVTAVEWDNAFGDDD